ncbi:MAG: hypothetical protein NTW21_09360 [Verrucomicrobia bacterium]|nr:hypothetical protein [Verrucomicrobiota bacterium]
MSTASVMLRRNSRAVTGGKSNTQTTLTFVPPASGFHVSPSSTSTANLRMREPDNSRPTARPTSTDWPRSTSNQALR